ARDDRRIRDESRDAQLGYGTRGPRRLGRCHDQLEPSTDLPPAAARATEGLAARLVPSARTRSCALHRPAPIRRGPPAAGRRRGREPFPATDRCDPAQPPRRARRDGSRGQGVRGAPRGGVLPRPGPRPGPRAGHGAEPPAPFPSGEDGPPLPGRAPCRSRRRIEARELAARTDNERDRRRLRCLEARLATRLEEDGAVELLAAARREMEAEGAPFEATALALDLATLLTR